MADAGKTILVVDDEESILRAAEATLRRGGYSPISTSRATDALEKSRNFKGDIHLLLTDVAMPEMGGLALAQQVLAERTEIYVLLMSGSVDVPSRLPLLRKPFRTAELLEHVAKVMHGPLPNPSDVLIEESCSAIDVRSALRAEVERARRRYLESSREFLEATFDVPSGIPHPDGVLRVERFAQIRKQCFEEYQRARKRLAEHV